MRLKLRLWPAGGITCLAFNSQTALAHSPLSSDGAEQVSALLTLAVLAIFWGLYLWGAWRRRPKLALFLCFNATAVLCALAVLGPLDDWAKTSTAAHMTQHMLLMVVIAPLWVLSRPLAQINDAGRQLVRWLWRPLFTLTRHPMITAYIHGFIIWFWHMPYFYMLAVDNPWWHAFEHFCFLFTAGIFWWAVLRGGRHHKPLAMLALLFTLMHTGFLGAILTFARMPLYGEARDLMDQQLAGLIMWVAGAVPYLLASIWIGLVWYQQLQRRMDAQESVQKVHSSRP